MIAALIVLSFFSCKKDSSFIDQTSLDLADDDAVAMQFLKMYSILPIMQQLFLIRYVKGGDSKSETVVTDSCPISNNYTSG